MNHRRSNEPFFWSLFSSGGMLTALVLPALVVVLWMAPAAGWIAPPGHGQLLALLSPLPARVALFVLVMLAAFHWGHRFRFTLYDGLQLSHLFGLIATICYGGAALLTLAAGWLLWSLP